MSEYFHSVRLDESKCMGCTNCIKRCPTEAIRVRNGKAQIINERCIDCGECVRVCPYYAKIAVTDDIKLINNYEYKIAIPAPSLYGQFKLINKREYLLTALKQLGFDDVFEVAYGAEIVSNKTKEILKDKSLIRPIISSACPAVVRLIQVRFPSLIDNLLKINAPMEVTAKIAREKASKETGIEKDKIGVFFISPCAAKVTSIKASFNNLKSNVDGVLSIKDVYVYIFNNLEKIVKPDSFRMASFKGIRWANAGGESLDIGTDEYLAVDGIKNVITILEEIENDRLSGVEFVEALSCTGGCIGGPLTVENVYVAKTRLKKFIQEANADSEANYEDYNNEFFYDWCENFEYKPILNLDSDISKAIKKLQRLEKINKDLPGLDCGACGSPTCRSLAEDIVRGISDKDHCIFKLKDKVRKLAKQMVKLEKLLSPVIKDIDEK